MSIDSFGYQVMSLREMLAELTEKAEKEPFLLDQPVWLAGVGHLYLPVKSVDTFGRPGCRLHAERG